MWKGKLTFSKIDTKTWFSNHGYQSRPLYILKYRKGCYEVHMFYIQDSKYSCIAKGLDSLNEAKDWCKKSFQYFKEDMK